MRFRDAYGSSPFFPDTYPIERGGERWVLRPHVNFKIEGVKADEERGEKRGLELGEDQASRIA